MKANPKKKSIHYTWKKIKIKRSFKSKRYNYKGMGSKQSYSYN